MGIGPKASWSICTGFLALAVTACAVPRDCAAAAVSHAAQRPLPQLVPPGSANADRAKRRLARIIAAQLPLSFEANQGQANGRVRFLSRGPGYSLCLEKTAAVLALTVPCRERTDRDLHPLSGAAKAGKSSSTTVRMEVMGGDRDSPVIGMEPLPGRVNYFIGNNPRKWRTNIPTYARVCYRDIYPGIDLAYYGQQHRLEYDFIVGPGQDPRAIRLRLQGARQVRVDRRGDLLVRTATGVVRWQKPVIYQKSGGTRRRVAGEYVVCDRRTIGFRVAAFDHKKPLIIDPVLAFSTFLGGQDIDYSHGIAADGSGNAYITGDTYSADFPAANALEPQSHDNSRDIGFVAKVDTIHSVLLYSTYFGGESPDWGSDWGQAIAVDGTGSAYVTGLTQSTDFPTINAMQPLLNRDGRVGSGESDGFVLKLNPTGSALLYSTYLGGTGHDRGTGIAADATGNAYVTGQTDSADFPTVNPAQAHFAGGNNSGGGDAFVCKLNAAGSALLYSTYLGGSGADGAAGIAVDASGSAYVAGATFSHDFPALHAVQPRYGGGKCDAFVTKLNPTGSALVYSTYLGGQGADVITGIAVDAAGSAYVVGSTSSPDFPVANALQPSIAGQPDPKYGYAPDGFVARLNGDGSALTFSTYLGGSAPDSANGIALDAAGNIYVAGGTESPDFPVVNAFQSSINGHAVPNYGFPSDGFVTKLDNLGSRLIYSTYLGGQKSDGAWGVAVDSASSVYVTGPTSSTDFPLVRPLQTELGGGIDPTQYDAFVVKISDSAPAPLADTQPPTTRAMAMPALNDGGWNTTPVAIDLTARDDGGSGVKAIRYVLTGAQTGSDLISGSHVTIRMVKDGVSVLTYYAVDNAGNQESAHTLPVRIDMTPPSSTITATPPPIALDWNNSPVMIRVHASDNPGGSGVKEIRYEVSGAQQEIGAVAGDTLFLTISADGSTRLAVYVVDNAGNQEAPSAGYVMIDSVPPVTMVTASPPPDAGGGNGTPMTLTLRAADSGPSPYLSNAFLQIHYSLTGAQTGSGVVYGDHARVDVTADGATTLTYYAVDFVGNQERPKSLVIHIDKSAISGDTQPPVTTAVATPPPNADGENQGPVKVSLDAVDLGGSGIYELHYSLSGAQTGGDVVNSSHVEFYVQYVGITTITYYAVDNALNQESPKVLTIRIAGAGPN
jgi:hypothetical protein